MGKDKTFVETTPVNPEVTPEEYQGGIGETEEDENKS